MPFIYKKRPICFLIDHTFLNDVFRPDYQHTNDGLWIFSYSITRYAFEPNEKILVVPKLILDILQTEGHSSITKNIYTISKFINVIPIKEESPNLAIIKLALLFYTQERFPIIISSVTEDKWLERVKKIGLDYNINGFSEQMSTTRLKNMFPAPIKKTDEAREIIYKYDSLFKKIDKKIHLEELNI